MDLLRVGRRGQKQATAARNENSIDPTTTTTTTTTTSASRAFARPTNKRPRGAVDDPAFDDDTLPDGYPLSQIGDESERADASVGWRSASPPRYGGGGGGGGGPSSDPGPSTASTVNGGKVVVNQLLALGRSNAAAVQQAKARSEREREFGLGTWVTDGGGGADADAPPPPPSVDPAELLADCRAIDAASGSLGGTPWKFTQCELGVGGREQWRWRWR